MGNNIVHFEINVDDIERAKKFYKQVLGWAFKDMDMGEMIYTLVYPSGKVTSGPAKVGINGGMMKRSGPAPTDNMAGPNAFVCTVSVDDVDAVIAKVVPNGGRVDMPIDNVSGVGRLAYIRDTEMNLLGILQPDMSAMAM